MQVQYFSHHHHRDAIKHHKFPRDQPICCVTLKKQQKCGKSLENWQHWLSGISFLPKLSEMATRWLYQRLIHQLFIGGATPWYRFFIWATNLTKSCWTLLRQQWDWWGHLQIQNTKIQELLIQNTKYKYKIMLASSFLAIGQALRLVSRGTADGRRTNSMEQERYHL